jgi:prevent-host-death family protein
MEVVSAQEAKRNLSTFLRRVKAGEEFTVTVRGIAVARLIGMPTAQPKRRLGLFAASMQVPAHFDAPLPKDLLDDFEGRKPKHKKTHSRKQ